MGKILDDYQKIVEENKEIIPDMMYEAILSNLKESPQNLAPDSEDRKKYFIEGYEDLSQAIFDFLYSARGSFIMGYTSEYKINRLSGGFKTIEELVHFSIWVIQRYYTYHSSNEKWGELKERDKQLSKKKILEHTLIAGELDIKIRELTRNMKTQDDFVERLALIKLKEEHETLAYEILSSGVFYKQLDAIFCELGNIPNVSTLNQIPESFYQTEAELRRIM